jgi:crossover junction endodeoxyribonuclease RuvC
MDCVGGDLSLTSTGVATAAGETLSLQPPKHLRGMDRLVWLRDAFGNCIAPFGRPADLVILEGYSYGSKFSHSHALGELGGVIRVWLHERGIVYVDVPPATLKVYVCGKGNATKDAVLVQAVRRSVREFRGGDEAEAFMLRAFGMAAYGFPLFDVPVPNQVAFKKIEWPLLDRALLP